MTLKPLKKASEWVSGQAVTEPRLRPANAPTKELTSVILQCRREEESEEGVQGDENLLRWCLAFGACMREGEEKRKGSLLSLTFCPTGVLSDVGPRKSCIPHFLSSGLSPVQ